MIIDFMQHKNLQQISRVLINLILDIIICDKKKRDSLETRVVHIKICMLCWNLANGPRHRERFFKNLTCIKGNQLCRSDFHAILNNIKAHRLQTIKK